MANETLVQPALKRTARTRRVADPTVMTFEKSVMEATAAALSVSFHRRSSRLPPVAGMCGDV
jgi:heat shock protein HslJ